MKSVLLYCFLLTLVLSCSGRKQIEKNLNRGNYDRAIYDALDRLRSNKEANRKQDFIALLGDAFIKAEKRDLARIEHLKKDGNPENFRTIYETYSKLNRRQEDIKPILPLYYKGKPLELRFKNYDAELISYRQKTSDYLHEVAQRLLNNPTTQNARDAYAYLKYVDDINPNFKNVRSLMNQAYNLGTEYVLVEINNESFQILPYRLEQALLNMDTYGLDEFWTVFHGEKVKDLDYDYKMELELRRINISPERVLQREFLRENEIVDGWEYQYDRNGNVMKDSLGNDIKVDKVVKVRARVNEFEQYKESQMLANVNFHDLRSERLLKSFPIESQFVFSNIYSTFRGDERALTFEDRQLLRNRPVQFPTNEQMVLDTGEDLKQKMRQIIRNFNFN